MLAKGVSVLDLRKENFEDFGGRLPWMGSRFYDENVCNMNVLDGGYKIMVPMAKINKPYLSLEKTSSKMHVEDFMVCIGRLPVGNSESKMYEQDVVDFCYKDYRGVGAIVYCEDKFMWAVKDFASKIHYPLKDVKLNKVLGNIYSCENLIGCSLEQAYKKLNMNIPVISTGTPSAADHTDELFVVKTTESEAAEKLSPSAAPATVVKEVVHEKPQQTVINETKPDNSIDVFVNVINKGDATKWTYTLLKGEHIKTDEGTFHKKGDTGYFSAAAGIIALSKVNKPTIINFYTPDKVLAYILGNGRLETWAKNGWKKDNGEALRNQPILAELYANTARLGGQITAQICAPDFRLAVI